MSSRELISVFSQTPVEHGFSFSLLWVQVLLLCATTHFLRAAPSSFLGYPELQVSLSVIPKVLQLCSTTVLQFLFEVMSREILMVVGPEDAPFCGSFKVE